MNPNDGQHYRGRLPSDALDLTPNAQGVRIGLNYTTSGQEALHIMFRDEWAGNVTVSFGTAAVPRLIAALTEFLENIEDVRAHWREMHGEPPR